ncbi:MAG: hypothetical protein GX032_01690 [Tenericutes bacterium]|nr:hypothetical protein [Bacilli bacterium]MDD3995324.1 hypothetical protein [Bacilli bacterium]MDD4624192.1 hypothetical protein [Bacilli bacterium]MDD4831622.1 hypothetical protein [Bacilli bacterium]NLV90169.1 hypothetical protein [Mycoplasmatota bacterium]
MKKKLMVDMDDVIVNGGLLYIINDFLGTNYTEDYFKSFYMQDIVEDKEAFFKFFLTKNMYDYCKLSENAYEVLEYLNEKYDLFIGTSYIFKEIPKESGKILLDKFNYLQDKLPFISPYKYIFLGDKSVLDFEVKIDDKEENLEGAEKKILFTAYHNKNISDEELKTKAIERALNWLDVKKLL